MRGEFHAFELCAAIEGVLLDSRDLIRYVQSLKRGAVLESGAAYGGEGGRKGR